MSTGSWDPKQQMVARADEEFLRQAIELGNRQDWQQLDTAFNSQQQQRCCGLMSLPEASWEPVLVSLGEDQLLALMRFFTVAEMKFVGWRAGERSPVIAIAKELKRRGKALDRNQLEWIRKHSDNRYIPFGMLK